MMLDPSLGIYSEIPVRRNSHLSRATLHTSGMLKIRPNTLFCTIFSSHRNIKVDGRPEQANEILLGWTRPVEVDFPAAVLETLVF